MSSIDALRAVRHDLGKYVSFQLRWLPEDAPDAELLDALRNDVLQTRRGPSGTESAPEIWKRLRPGVASLDLGQIDADVGLLADHVAALESGDASHDVLVACAAAARRISTELTRLHKALKEP